MVKPLSFKGDKKAKKRKRTEASDSTAQGDDGDSKKQLKTADEKEVAAVQGEDNGGEHDDSWVSADAVSDVSGPIMFVLPTEPPSALACDAVGKVFTLPIENIVDGNPSSAEPHDVRQVWVANKIVGTEHYRFKGHHGKYLSCDKIGLFSATSEAVSPLESFSILPTADTPGAFQVQTLRDTFLTVRTSASSKSGKAAVPEVRGDAADMSFDSTLRIRMQARFKPRIKASKEEKAREKISRSELEQAVGRRLEEDEVKRLKRARREGDYHEVLLDIKVKSKHDKYG
ncbi:FRG1-like family-domain-containing protein [Apodospora peruviana]|uniref:FRG1-like family-domain-containing protein n=1 Tax=Apodospora peruviana TaxID=516989 RepID=A0AAE0MF93_9PEZI|nr:FRG1-like family-domain-containing protein [Apodospora peruviana]